MFESIVSTGVLPQHDHVREIVTEAYDRYRGDQRGEVADYIPALGRVDPELFGVSVLGVGGDSFDLGDADHRFSIQSISKAFVFALVCQAIGHAPLREAIGVDNTGLPFNSVMAVELNGGRPGNPMVNAGAIATTALVPGSTPGEKWATIREGLGRFAGRPLELDREVYESESTTNQRNESLARLLESYGRLHVDPLEAVDVYTQQCSLLVDAHDLAVMGATLANGGVNPVTEERVVDASVARDTLAVLSATGLYERSGDWLFEIGIPGKSGVSGGIVTIAPGKGALGTFAPRLDPAGNSVKGQRVAAHLSKSLGLDIFASASARASAGA